MTRRVAPTRDAERSVCVGLGRSPNSVCDANELRSCCDTKQSARGRKFKCARRGKGSSNPPTRSRRALKSLLKCLSWTRESSRFSVWAWRQRLWTRPWRRFSCLQQVASALDCDSPAAASDRDRPCERVDANCAGCPNCYKGTAMDRVQVRDAFASFWGGGL